jgi:hypothetical protein
MARDFPKQDNIKVASTKTKTKWQRLLIIIAEDLGGLKRKKSKNKF